MNPYEAVVHRVQLRARLGTPGDRIAFLLAYSGMNSLMDVVCRCDQQRWGDACCLYDQLGSDDAWSVLGVTAVLTEEAETMIPRTP